MSTFSKRVSSNLVVVTIFALVLTTTALVTSPAHASIGGNGSCETASFTGGDGGSGNPWQVSSVNALKELGDCRAFSNYHYVLTGNLDLGTSAQNPWTPIANTQYAGFTGKLDGAGNKISGLYVLEISSDTAGLFGFLDNGAEVRNLVIENASVSGEHAGILAAKTRETVILENLTISGTVNALGADQPQRTYVGGIVGQFAYLGCTPTAGTVTLSNLHFEGNIVDLAGVEMRSGGLFGETGNSCSTTDARVLIQSSSAKVHFSSIAGITGGGLIGYAFNTRIVGSKADFRLENYQSSQTGQQVSFGGAVGLLEESQLEQLHTMGDIFFSGTGTRQFAGLANNVRNASSALSPRHRASSVINSLANLQAVTRNSSDAFTAGIVGYLQGGTVSNNVSIMRTAGFQSARVAGAIRSIQSGPSFTVNQNLFDSTVANTNDPGSSLTSAQASPASSSSLSQLATLTNYGFSSSIWGVSASPFLKSVPGSELPASPRPSVLPSGNALEIYFGEQLKTAPAPAASDFAIQFDGEWVVPTSATLDSSRRLVTLGIAENIPASASVNVSYSPSIAMEYDFKPTNTEVDGFYSTSINRVIAALPNPDSSSITPTQVQIFETTEISLDGTGLLGSTVQIQRIAGGGRGAVQVVSATDNRLVFKAPNVSNNSLGDYRVVIANRGGHVIIDPAFAYLAPPSISNVTPAIGGPGTIVEVGGSNLSTATTISFGTTQVPVSSVTATTISVVAPAGTVGQTVDITAAGPGWTSTLNARFQFTQSPSLSGISPSSGSTAGGETVTLTGVTFSDLISVTFGGVQATVVSSSSTEVQVTSPAASAGVVDVVVRTGGGTSTLAGAFTYVAPNPPQQQTGGSQNGQQTAPPVVINTPTITEFSTREISANGGEVTATGLRLENISVLTLGGITVTLVSNTATSLTFTIGEMPVGVWDLRLVGSNGTLVFQQAIEVVEATAVVAESTGELLGYTWTLKFIGNSRSLHEAQAAHLTRRLNPNAETIICWGYTTAENPNAWAIAHATQRAQAACDLALANNPEVKTVVRLRYGVQKSWAMRSALQFWR